MHRSAKNPDDGSLEKRDSHRGNQRSVRYACNVITLFELLVSQFATLQVTMTGAQYWSVK